MLIINNNELGSVCTMGDAVEALYEGLRSYNLGGAVRRPRIDLLAPTSRAGEFSCFSSMDGLIKSKYYAIRIKPDIVSWPTIANSQRRTAYAHREGLYGGLILLYAAENAELLAIMNDGFLQHLRVGATAALGARFLMKKGKCNVGILGTGGMARSFADGFAAVKKIGEMRFYSPNAEHLKICCEEVGHRLGVEAIPAANAHEAIEGCDIVASCTNSQSPTLKGDWLESGMYVSNVSGWEFDQRVYERITVVGSLTYGIPPMEVSNFRDYRFEKRNEVMSYIAGSKSEVSSVPIRTDLLREFPNARRVPCVDWVEDRQIAGVSDEDISLLADLTPSVITGEASSGIHGIQFASVAGRAYELAKGKGVGRELPLDLFLQDVPT